MLRILLAPPDCVIEEDRLALEFPTVRISRALPAPSVERLAISAAEWRSASFDTWAFDEALRAKPIAIHLLANAGEDLTEDALRILTRAQWTLDRRNQASHGARFDTLLERHALLHDREKPLVRIDWEHGLDVWQWTLRLKPNASLALQAAALFHDVERVASEADARVEHLATDHEAWERTHAEASARIALPLLADVFDDPLALERALELIRTHASPRDPDAQVLADADSLSFMERGLAHSVMHHGPAHAKRKLDKALARLSPAARIRARLEPPPTDAATTADTATP